MISSFVKLFRVNEWYDSKIPMLTAATYYLLVRQHARFSYEALTMIGILILFYSVSMALGYIVNDYADMETDKLAGKKKLLHKFSKRTALLIVIGTVLTGCLPVLLYSPNWQTALLLAFIYLFGVSYSVPPFRFKEKGVWGLIVSSTAQRCFPLLIIFALQPTEMEWVLLLWMLLSFIDGLRYILVHQYIDLENDMISGVRTFTTGHQKMTMRLIPVVFLSEILLTGIILFPAAAEHLWMLYVLAGYVVISVIRWQGVKAVFRQKPLYTYYQMPLEDLYNHYLPLMLSTALMEYDQKWVVLLLIWAVFLLYPAAVRLSFPIQFLVKSIGNNIRKKRTSLKNSAEKK